MKNIVITGATSFLAQYLLSEMAGNDVVFHLLVRESNCTLDNFLRKNKAVVYKISMDDYDKVHEKINMPVDGCFHLSWEGTRKPYRNDRAIQKNNYINSMNLFESISKLGCKKIIAIGSQAEYAKTDEKIYETSKMDPATYYGKYKLKTGLDAIEKFRNSGVRFFWARIFSLYGKGDYEKTLIMSCVKKMLNNEVIELTESTQKWNFLHVSDAARAIISLYNNKMEAGIYNVASKDTRELRAFIEEIKTFTRSSSELLYGKVEYGEEGKTNLVPSIEKLLSHTNWKERISFSQGISDIVESLHKM